MLLLKNALQVNLCPWFAPVHMHKGGREEGRLRINSPQNDVHAGETLDMSSMCQSLDTAG